MFFTGMGLLGGLTAAAGVGSSLLNYFSGKSTQETTWSREDDAVQRRAADLEKAGLSKTLAAGSAANAGVTSAPQFEGGQISDALNSAMQIANIKNAKEENANLRTSNDVMKADIGLKFGQMKKAFAEENYFNQQAATSAVDSQLKSTFMLKAMQDIEESKERSKGYKFRAESDYANSLLHTWEAANAALDNSLINLTGSRSSVGGIAPTLLKLGGRTGDGILRALHDSSNTTFAEQMLKEFEERYK